MKPISFPLFISAFAHEFEIAGAWCVCVSDFITLAVSCILHFNARKICVNI